MKSLRQLCVALVVTLSLAIHTFAGGIETGIAPPPPALAGEIQIGVAGQMDTMVNGDIETGLSLIESLLALF